ncbi:hypothetical protein A2U01_0040565 [Trifolium medium]|uniref:Uncharacterized protein n=1 Tax=Trifolium medium TaxID=97028 RepID=A0A392Q6D0_9FABA|nr:hypothetical protein [Trifolium medium]
MSVLIERALQEAGRRLVAQPQPKAQPHLDPEAEAQPQHDPKPRENELGDELAKEDFEEAEENDEDEEDAEDWSQPVKCDLLVLVATWLLPSFNSVHGKVPFE